jgi:lipid II:glycine glycyltransferase (peptidoglycan interpeptide bridge formation enzyme)
MLTVIENKRIRVQVRELPSSESAYWDREIQRFDFVHPLNAYGWGQVRSVDNWTPIYLVAEREGKFSGGMMILKKKLPFLPFSIFYSPKGPVWDYEDDETLSGLIAKVKEIARGGKAIFLRVDPNIRESFAMDNEDKLSSLGFNHLDKRWTYWNSPRDVARIDLTKVNDANEFFSMLDRDTRRCIRKAEREGVRIEAATSEEELRAFYNIFKEFSVNKRFMSRDYEYQKCLWDTYIVKGMGRLFLAKYEGKIIGGLICIMFGRKCLAMHMGTPYKYQKLQTYYAYVWEGIKWAKENGCSWFSFRGVGTTPTQEYFKNKYLPEAVGLVGYYDLSFRSFLYKIFYFGEFSVLPRAWPILVSGRKLYNRGMKIFRRSQ